MMNDNNYTNIKYDSISGEINLILNNIPKNINELELTRWLYIKLGNLLCYDIGIVIDKERIYKKLNYTIGENNSLDKYQTCIQIAKLFCDILNYNGIKSSIIERELTDRRYAINHQATKIELKDGTKYLLDLTLDLYLIQSGCMTKEFGYTTDNFGTYDIIPLIDIEKIDRKLELVDENGYTDQKITDLKEKLSLIINDSSLSTEEKLRIKIDRIIATFPLDFRGPHEGSSFIDKLFKDILSITEFTYLKKYNMFYKNKDNELSGFVTCYVLNISDYDYCYLYNNNIGLISTNRENILAMLHDNWETNSLSLYDTVKNNHKSR